jgi:ribosomal protein S18 acetylase RimI-like enzyme
MLLRLSPGGALAALIDTSVVGTAIGIDYGGFAWIAMMLVDPAYRGRGIGRRLLEAAMEAMPRHLRIRLDATPLGRPLYQRYGFEDEATLSRHVRDGSSRRLGSMSDPADSHRVRPLTPSDLETVVEGDVETFGGARRPVLDWAFHAAPRYAYVVHADDGMIHYCFGRPGRLFDQIGPVVAGHENIAAALVDAALAAAGARPVVIDAFDAQAGFSATMRRRGFVIQRPLIRMCRAAASAVPEQRAHALRTRPDSMREFAIFGPEFA